ncbi:hypothetical protein C8R45DRAFT_1072916 [Mycena sanguinolenta]|nr:hypothetical protein C8R45DRAFT_1072916 [Mycena sanguinolenta]
MFSKALALGLGALALVSAAPASFQSFQFSCSATSVAPVKSLDIAPGKYGIYNVAYGAQLRSFNPEQPIFVTLTRDFPGDFGIWELEDGEDWGKIANVGLRAAAKATRVAPCGAIVATRGIADRYSIEPAGDNTFTIKVPNEDLVWAVNRGLVRSDVFLKPADGTPETRWEFRPVQRDEIA